MRLDEREILTLRSELASIRVEFLLLKATWLETKRLGEATEARNGRRRSFEDRLDRASLANARMLEPFSFTWNYVELPKTAQDIESRALCFRADDSICSKSALAAATGQRAIAETRLPDVLSERSEALAEWDRRAAAQDGVGSDARSGTALAGVEERLVRRFAGRVNQRRQRDLGITHYVWRSRDDDKVRTAHAANDDQIVRWDSPPEGGHPGEAINCRCVAEPVFEDGLLANMSASRTGLILASE